MSATSASDLIKELQPDWDIQIYERLSDIAQESSNPWNNAGTGHSALCELNYTPERVDGSIDITNAVKVNEQFQVHAPVLVLPGALGADPEPREFINPTPHMSFVTGEDERRVSPQALEALKDHPLFEGMEYSEDPRVIRSWAPLIIPGRLQVREVRGHQDGGGHRCRLRRAHPRPRRPPRREWRRAAPRASGSPASSAARTASGSSDAARHRRDAGPGVRRVFVFVGAGGGALNLLQQLRASAEIRGFGGFPVSGEFLRTDNPDLVAQHAAKVYGKAAVGSPPMSVPHHGPPRRRRQGQPDVRPVRRLQPAFLKHGSYLDLFASIRLHNLFPMIQAGLAATSG